jgi:uncharacterized protein YutE (UPF0331/DUF86 family)
MPDDILLNKSQIIRRCIARIREEYAGNLSHLDQPTKQDSIVLNLQRAAEAAIGLAMHMVAGGSLGVPQTSRDAFRLLEDARIIEAETAERMRAMVGFRNIAIHEYQQLDTSILRDILENHLADFERFIQECARTAVDRSAPTE